MRWGTNFLKFFYLGNQKSQILSNLDRSIVYNLGLTFENADYMQILSVLLNKSIREKNEILNTLTALVENAQTTGNTELMIAVKNVLEQAQEAREVLAELQKI